jgi:carboxymethylenebutenolidase
MTDGWLLSRRAALGGSTLLLGPGAMAQPQSNAPRPEPEKVSMVLPGNVTHRAKLFKPAKSPAPGIILVHDGWGATADFEAMGATLAFEGMMALVVDLAGGKIAESAADTERLAREIEAEQPGETISAWYDWLRNRLESDRRVGAFGFGPGGRWAVKGSTHKSANGCAIWSVRIDTTAQELHSIYEIFVGHFSDRDTVPGQVIVADLSQRLRAAQREGHLFRYSSKPGFYNPRSPDYDKPDATLAWRRSVAVFKKMWSLG